MPDPKLCDKIADPAARERCKNYEGEFAKPAGSNPGSYVKNRMPGRAARRNAGRGYLNPFKGVKKPGPSGGGWGQY